METKTTGLVGHEANALPYCATCKKYLSAKSVNDKLIGQRFLCTGWSAECIHVSAVVRKGDASARWWLDRQAFLARYQKWSSDVLIDTKVAFVLQFFALLLALLFAPWPGWGKLAAFFIATLYVSHCLLYNTSVAFVTQLPKAPLRSVVLGLAAFFGLALSFAVFYLALAGDELKVKGTLDRCTAVYFSLVTIVTLGYGDIHPKPAGYFAYLLVGLEIFAGLYFLSILLVTMVSWASGRERLPTLREILQDSQSLDHEGSHI